MIEAHIGAKHQKNDVGDREAKIIIKKTTIKKKQGRGEEKRRERREEKRRGERGTFPSLDLSSE